MTWPPSTSIRAKDNPSTLICPGVHQLDAPLVNISSTSVRERVANGEEIATLVPKAVADYIVCQRLYQSEAKGG